MPYLTRRDGAEVYLESGHDVSRRGRRLDHATTARLRDISLGFLVGMGLTSVEISRARTLGARRARSVVRTKNHPQAHDALAGMALHAVVRGAGRLKGIRDCLVCFLSGLGADCGDIGTVIDAIARPASTTRYHIGAMPPAILSKSSLAGRNAISSIPRARIERARLEIARAEEGRLAAAKLQRAEYMARTREAATKRQRELYRLRRELRRQERASITAVAWTRHQGMKLYQVDGNSQGWKST